MKVWIVVLALLLLVGLILRERFETYEEALRDVGQTAGYITPSCETGFTMSEDKSKCEKTNEDGTKETKEPTCPSGSSYVKRQNRGVCEPTGGGTSGGPGGTTTETSGGPGGTESSTPPAPSSSTDSQTTSVPAPATTPATTTPTSSVTGTTTGGTSGNVFGPTSGGVGKTGKNVWGPVFTGFGEASGQDGDSTRTNQYPNLLGGMMGKESTRIPGVGIVTPSQPGFGLDMGVLPSSSSLGTDANARFLPFSRPGADVGFTADPYRLAKGYSTKNYSPENEPVPFLTDFSAFFK